MAKAKQTKPAVEQPASAMSALSDALAPVAASKQNRTNPAKVEFDAAWTDYARTVGKERGKVARAATATIKLYCMSVNRSADYESQTKEIAAHITRFMEVKASTIADYLRPNLPTADQKILEAWESQPNKNTQDYKTAALKPGYAKQWEENRSRGRDIESGMLMTYKRIIDAIRAELSKGLPAKPKAEATKGEGSEGEGEGDTTKTDDATAKDIEKLSAMLKRYQGQTRPHIVDIVASLNKLIGLLADSPKTK